MRRRPLGSTSVTELAFGTAPLGNLYAPVGDDDAAAAVRAAWDGGVRAFDTAPHYGLGLAERRLGRALAGVPREQLTISTKVGRLLEPNPSPSGSDLAAGGFAVADDLVRRRDYSADGVRRSLEESLGRLGLDRVDVVYVHDPEEHMEQAVNEAVPALVTLREQGVVDAVGVGMNVVAPLRRLVAETDIDAVLVAGRYTLVDRTAEPLLDDCAQRGVAVVAAAPFNSGLLSRPEPPPTGRFDYGPVPIDVLTGAQECARVCAAHDVSLPQAALQFPLRHAAVTCVLAGMRTAAEVREGLAWLTAPIADELWEQLPAPARVARAMTGDGMGDPGAERSRPVSVKGICVRDDGRVLLCRNHRGEWELPGGRPEPGEDHAGCLRRELREETGLVIEPGRPLGTRPFEVLPGRWVDVVAFACTLTAEATEATEAAGILVSAEHTAVAFLDVATLPRDALPEVYRELIAAVGR